MGDLKVRRSLVVVVKGPVLRILRAFPPIERAARALLRRFPRLAAAYRRSSMTTGLESGGGVGTASLQPAPVRKIALSESATTIYRDLQAALHRQRKYSPRAEIQHATQSDKRSS